MGSTGEWRIVALNIRHGGGRRVERLATRLLGYAADVLVLTEFRNNASGHMLRTQLEQLGGYTVAHATDLPKDVNTVAIATRDRACRPRPFDVGPNTPNLWCADVGPVTVCGVYMPLGAAKATYWQTLIKLGRDKGLDMIIGDFNRAYAHLDQDPRSVDRSVDPDWPIQLMASGYVDVWRVTHPGVREYSWFSPRANNGFRIDHAYATPAMAGSVIACEFDRAPLEQRETDHCALTLSLSST